MQEPSARDRFLALVSGPEASIDVAEAALWIAAEDRGGVDVGAQSRRIDELASRARASVEAADSPREAAERLSHHLSAEEGFRGNAGDYYDARNSYLDEVIERRVGIPITLSILWIATAARLGLAARGVGFPGHFLVRLEDDPDVMVDAFGGRLMDESDCRELLLRMTGSDEGFSTELLAPTPAREILARVLRNLKQIHLRASEHEQALHCSDRILALLPDDPVELLERGLLFRALECWGAAERDLERSLALSPDPPVVDKLRAVLAELRQRAPRLQ